MKLKTKRAESFNDIVTRVAQVHNVKLSEIKSHSRKHELVRVRAIAFNILYTRYGAKLAEIGRLFKRHHSTIIHGLKTHESFMYSDNSYVSDYMETIAMIESEEERTIRDRALEILNEIESLKTIGKKIIYVEKLIERYEHKSINCDNEPQRRV